MTFSKDDLLKMDTAYLASLTEAQSRQLNVYFLEQLKILMDRLNQNSRNSSTPPSKDPLWSKDSEPQEGKESDTACDQAQNPESTEPPKSTSDESKKAGKQPGTVGYGRKIELPINDTKHHKPCQCEACGLAFDDGASSIAINGHYTLDIEIDGDKPGLIPLNIKHIYYETTCCCGHKTQRLPNKASEEEGWSVAMSEWHLCGPTLVSMIVCLSKRYHLSRNKIEEFLIDWLGIRLSKGVISKCIQEAGRAVAPLEEELIKEIEAADLIHIDETGWKELSKKLWLWTFATTTVCLFVIGPRTKSVVKKILDSFDGTLMSDGYNAYRHFKNRLRCWAHLERKLTGLAESTDKVAQEFGQYGLDIFDRLKKAIKLAREGPDTDIMEEHTELLAQFKQVCVDLKQCNHEKTCSLAKEFLNDWDAIWLVLSNVDYPLTNNEAERLLRHWVINRQISFGTRNSEGSRGHALLASVIETCRLRNVKPWPYLAEVLAARRKNMEVPKLPQMAPA